MNRLAIRSWASAWFLVAGAGVAWGQPAQDRYDKHEYQVPMRDGVKLFTAVYTPKDATQAYPFLMTRTPYSVAPYGPESFRWQLGPSHSFDMAGYIFVYQDVRGKWMSEGEFVNMRPHLAVKDDAGDIDESTDTFDTIEWLLANVPNHNGKLGMTGISYPGFYTAAGMIDAHPALKAASPQAPIVDWFTGDDFHHNGAFFTPHLFDFMAWFGPPRPGPTTQGSPRFDYGTQDGYEFYLRMGPLANANERYFKNEIPFWSEVMGHGSYDEFWQSRNLRPHLKEIRPAVLTVGGWFDAENLYGALQTYKHVEAQSPGAVNTLVMGPWRHGGWAGEGGDSFGMLRFHENTAEFYRDKIEFPFFEKHLRDRDIGEFPEAWVYETGVNEWRTHDVWPPRAIRPRELYFAGGEKLADMPPETSDPATAFDEYTSDPDKPVPSQDEIHIGMDPHYMAEDQRFAARRPDVLVYQTDPLAAPVTVAGPIDVSLFVSTSGTDSDWVVKLIDVYPDRYTDETGGGQELSGIQQLVRGDVMRGKFRNSFERPEPFVPGEPAKVAFQMNDCYHTFRPGHRIMVQVQSTWFPVVDRNPQTFVDIYNAQESDFQSATQRVYRTRELPSKVALPVLGE